MKSTTAALFLLPIVSAFPASVQTTNPRLLLADDISLRSADSFSRLALASKSFDPANTSRDALTSRQLAATTQNDIKNGDCKPMTILFARGTTEQGNVGSLTGPPFFQAVGAEIGAQNVAVQGVDYPADIPGFLAGGDAGGSKLMAQMVGQIMTACPTTNLVMSGYSQGGQLVHNAASMLTPAQSSFVQSAVIFGDPDNGDAVGAVSAADTKIICHTGDLICAGTATVLAPHLTYSKDAEAAASFVIGNMKAAA